MPSIGRTAVVATALLALVVAPVAAQDATPASFPVTPDPSECRVPPRPRDEVLALLAGTPVAAASPAAGLPASVATEDQLPAGEPADAATVAAIVATARELIACNNAGDFARVFAFYTDDLIRRVFGGDPALAAQVPVVLATPAAALPVAARTELLAVREVRVLADGRVGAVIEDRDPRRTVAFFMIFVRAGDRWLVDGQIDIQGVAGTPAAGTPAP